MTKLTSLCLRSLPAPVPAIPPPPPPTPFPRLAIHFICPSLCSSLCLTSLKNPSLHSRLSRQSFTLLDTSLPPSQYLSLSPSTSTIHTRSPSPILRSKRSSTSSPILVNFVSLYPIHVRVIPVPFSRSCSRSSFPTAPLFLIFPSSPYLFSSIRPFLSFKSIRPTCSALITLVSSSATQSLHYFYSSSSSSPNRKNSTALIRLIPFFSSLCHPIILPSSHSTACPLLRLHPPSGQCGAAPLSTTSIDNHPPARLRSPLCTHLVVHPSPLPLLPLGGNTPYPCAIVLIPPHLLFPYPTSILTAPFMEALPHPALNYSLLSRPPSDPTRLNLLAEYLSLQPSSTMRHSFAKEESATRVAGRMATRLNLSRELQLAESPSEKRLLDNALIKCTQRVAVGRNNVRNTEDLLKRQRSILATLYPAHPSLDLVLQTLSHLRRRTHTLRKAIRDQSDALAKLTDASNLLLLISNHVQLLNTCYANSCTSSSSDWSSEDEMTRAGCLGRSDECRSVIYLSGVPGAYRVRYLRKCWGYAAEALEAAVDLSSYLAVQLERQGRTELVPGIEAQSKPSMALLEFPGGLTFIFRSDLLQKMSEEAKSMREAVQGWQRKQRKFIGRIRRDLSRTRKKAGLQEAKLAELRQTLLAEEFADAHPSSFSLKSMEAELVNEREQHVDR